MALSATVITPIVDVLSLDTSDPASEVFEVQSGTTTSKADIDYNNQKVENQVFTVWGKLLETKRTVWTYTEEGTAGASYVLSATSTFTTNSWTNSSVTVSVTDCLVGDDLEIECWGDWQLNTASSAVVAGRGRINIIQDAGGTPTAVPNVYGKSAIVTPGGGTLPHISNYSFTIKHRVTLDGDVSVTLQVRYEDLVGGAGTATIILMLSARLDVVRYRRT